MVPDMEKPRVTEFQVRIDCNGCVQKIKKALSGINGIQDIYIDIPQQKLTIIGWADLGKIVKALKKTRKLATICSEAEPSIPIETEFENGGPIPDPSNPPPTELVPPVEQPEEPQNPPSEPEPAPPSESKETEEVHMVQNYPQDHSHRYNQEQVTYNASFEHYSSSHHPQYEHEPSQPILVNHSYNTYKPTPYVTKYKYVHPPPQNTHYNRPEPPQQFTHYYDRPEPPPLQQTHYTEPERPRYYTHYSRPEPPPPQQTHYTRPEPPLQQTRYTRPEPPLQQTRYTRPEPPLQQTRYTRPEPPLQYTHYYKSEPPQPYTNYAQQEPPPQYSHNGGEYYSSSNGNGNITSIFSDENPNACTIV